MKRVELCRRMVVSALLFLFPFYLQPAQAASIVHRAGANAQPNAQANGSEIVGMFRIVSSTDLGEEVRVTMRIELRNNTDEAMTVKRAALHHSMPLPGERAGARQMEAAKELFISLEPHASESFTHDFLLSKLEFEQLEKGIRPHLRLTFQPAGGEEMTYAFQIYRDPMPETNAEGRN